MEIIEKKVLTILRPTGIALAPYVVNPYQGCAFACVFCYARTSKVARQEKIPWGQYVKVKINAAEVLKKEIKLKTPRAVLIGSTTEPFQSAEQTYHITRSILEILNDNKIQYVIMSRSPLIAKEMDFIDKNLCKSVYFTISMLPEDLKQEIEPHAPGVDESISVINTLRRAGVKTTAYFCPIMPFFYNTSFDIDDVDSSAAVEFEILNFQMADMKNIINILRKKPSRVAAKYEKMCRDKRFYDKVMAEMKETIKNSSKSRSPNAKIHSHAYQEYFKNVY